MAAPHTAGVAAMYLEDQPSASPAEVRDVLYDATTKNVVSDAQSGNDHLLYNAGFDANPLSAGVSGPNYLDEGEFGTWTASASGGDGSYDYDWAVRNSPSDPWAGVCGSSSTCTWGIDQISETLDADIRVIVSSDGQEATGQMGFVVNNNGGGGDDGGGDDGGGGCNNDASEDKICL